jgi:hypothetical protein
LKKYKVKKNHERKKGYKGSEEENSKSGLQRGGTKFFISDLARGFLRFPRR